MENKKRAEKLYKWYCGFGTKPEKCTVYPLPVWSPVKTENAYIISKKAENGEVFIFEFGFPVPINTCEISWRELESSIPHHCSTCEWDFCRGKGTPYCKATEEICSGECPDWDLAPDAIRLAGLEYYKQLHEKHYGKISVSV